MQLPDRAALRLPAFIGGLVLALLVGFGVGRVAGPTSGTAAPGGAMSQTTAQPGDGHNHGMTTNPTGDVAVGGLVLSSNGYTLVAESTAFPAGAAAPLRFRIHGPDGKPVNRFATVHDKQLHLIVARRDLSGYQHLHPAMAPDGTWQIALTLPRPGVWRAFADFTAYDSIGGQHPTTLGIDLSVAGPYQPTGLPAPARESTVDNFTVTYEGTPQLKATTPLLFRVHAGGAPVLDLQRYLGSYGHLVVLREGDLAYVHVHPEEQLINGAVKFWLAAPSPGRYRLFFDFQIGDTVRTAEYTMTVA